MRVADGLSNREVARELCLSEHTIKKYLFRTFDKLGISSRVELVLYALSHGDLVRQSGWPEPTLSGWSSRFRHFLANDDRVPGL